MKRKRKSQFNLAYMSAAAYPIIMLGFINKSWVVIILGFLLLASFIIGGKIQAKANKPT
ncbi:hypothetical protein [Lederbergia panacisoli]|uniref:hypothetical protein n=1 Tax=Lederbergia panacisoli TaxID=1255251 RepID=UPI00214B8C8B|nr:hypothetical protein [Lederbergia panacisoli]MCR2821220.1 hypothetical protein [Lederbergia panacisoli]